MAEAQVLIYLSSRLVKHGAKPKTKSFCNLVEKVEGEER